MEWVYCLMKGKQLSRHSGELLQLSRQLCNPSDIRCLDAAKRLLEAANVAGAKLEHECRGGRRQAVVTRRLDEERAAKTQRVKLRRKGG